MESINRLNQLIRNMNEEQIKNLIFAIEWGYLSLEELEFIRKDLKDQYNKFLRDNDLTYKNIKQMNDEQRLKGLIHQNRYTLLLNLEILSKNNTILPR